MIFSSHHQAEASKEYIDFLIHKIGLSEKAIELGIRQANKEQAPLAVVLWSFGLLDLNQFQEVLNWKINN